MSIDPVIATDRPLRAWAGCFSPRRRTSCSDMVDFRVGARDVSDPARARSSVLRRGCVVGVGDRIGIGMLWQFAAALCRRRGVVARLCGRQWRLNLLRGRRFIDCGCGGAAQPLSIGLVLRNVVLAIGAVDRVGAERRRARSTGSTSSAWSPRRAGARRAVRGDESTARGARTARGVGVMDALIVSNIVLWILVDRTRVRRVRADATDRRAARTRLARPAR